MQPWPKCPIIYEINAWVWLGELSERYGSAVTLGNIPGREWDSLASFRIDAVWFMGVWERSPEGIRIANADESLLSDFRTTLPDFRTSDNIGSPYCVRRYAVDERLGGKAGLASAREELSKRGIRLILDFVPNQVAPDHAWVDQHPDYLMGGDTRDVEQNRTSFMEINGRVFACGRDTHLPPWLDVLQLNAFSRETREGAVETLKDIADQCDGVRCAMAALLLNDVFEGTWSDRAGPKPDGEYWAEVIAAVREGRGDFLFIAEGYGDLEWRLQQQGFDYCCDKLLYERMAHGSAESVKLHLTAEPAYQEKLVRFIENHHEPCAASTFTPEQEQAAAIVMGTLPGAKLLHEGQFEGRRIRLPVFLGRRPCEKPDRYLSEFYRKLLDSVNVPVFRSGRWQLCAQTGWPDNQSYRNIAAWCWQREEERYLTVVNLSCSPAQSRVQVPWPDIKGKHWQLLDVFAEDIYERDGDEMIDPGLYIELGPWEFHFLRFF